VSYALSLKHEPVLDLAAVASGFLLRAIAGGVATGIALSQWFLLVAAFGSLFMVAGKRYSEIRSVGSEAGTRRALQEYSATYLRFVWMLAAGITVTAYSLWALDAQRRGDLPWESLSIVPFVLGLLRYALDVDRGDAGAPEDIVLGDRTLQVLGGVWLVLVVCGIWQV
jgi:decaprenyl-phosphate phosphoribosyltransferase